MSFASTLRPVGLSFTSPVSDNTPGVTGSNVPFHNEPNYLQLQRMLTRYQNLILQAQPHSIYGETAEYELSPLQRQIRAELYSSLPYHRTKWLHSVESARNLLLNLERHAQNLKSPKAKKEALRDLALKRQIIRRLRTRIEEIGREVESAGHVMTNEDEELLGERADAVLVKLGIGQNLTKEIRAGEKTLQDGKPVTMVSEDNPDDANVTNTGRDTLFDSSIRRRQGQGIEALDGSSTEDRGVTSGFSNLAQTEKSLRGHAREHEDLTSALVSMAAQLKQQSRAFQFSLTQDEGFLNRAVEGLDLNITSMEAASKNMAFLRRMSEEQGWLGRLKLYGIILALWVFAILLVFVGPKLRF